MLEPLFCVDDCACFFKLALSSQMDNTALRPQLDISGRNEEKGEKILTTACYFIPFHLDFSCMVGNAKKELQRVEGTPQGSQMKLCYYIALWEGFFSQSGQ